MVAGGAQGILEMFATPFGPIKTGVASVAEMFEPAFEKVVGGQMRDGAIVGLEPGEGRDEARGADIDDRNRDVLEGGGDGGIFDARDNAVAVPMRKPGGGLIAAVVFGKVKGPGAVFANKGNNAAQKAARVSVGSFDQESDFDGRLHGVTR